MKTNLNASEPEMLIPTSADYSELWTLPGESREVYLQTSDGSGYRIFPAEDYGLDRDFVQKLEDSVRECGGSLDQIVVLSARGVKGQISGEVEKFRGLNKLYLSHNDIAKIPKEIGSLAQLQCLYLNHNDIAKIPKEIGNLAQLQCLDLSHNGITEIPEELANLAQLQWLDLSHNGITEIPKELANRIKPEWLDVRGNPIARIPKSLEYRAIHDGNIKPAALSHSEHYPRKMDSR